jgi:hypothetical protein
VTRETIIDGVAATVPRLLATAGLVLPAGLGLIVEQGVAAMLRGLVPENCPVVAHVEVRERVDERP